MASILNRSGKGGTVRVEWYGDKVIPKIQNKAFARLEIAGREVRDLIKKRLNRSQPTRGRGAKKRGLWPSTELAYPKKVTGHLRTNVVMRSFPKTLSVRVGTNVAYGAHLEFGTFKMARRPWLSKGVAESMPTLRRLLGG